MITTVFTKEAFMDWIGGQIPDGETVAITNIFSAFQVTKKKGHTATMCFPDFIFNGEPDIRNISTKTPCGIIIGADLSDETREELKETGTISYKF